MEEPVPGGRRPSSPPQSGRLITDAQKALGDVLSGYQHLRPEMMPTEELASLEAHLRRRLPQLENLVHLLRLPPEDPMLDPVENTRGRILGVVHEAGEKGIAFEDLEKAVRLGYEERKLFRETLGQIVADGRIKIEGPDNRVFWVVKPGEEVNDLGVLNSVYDGMGGVPTPPDATTS